MAYRIKVIHGNNEYVSKTDDSFTAEYLSEKFYDMMADADHFTMHVAMINKEKCDYYMVVGKDFIQNSAFLFEEVE